VHYEDAILLNVLYDAYKITGKNYYKYVVKQPIAFLLREMNENDVGFYSALDANSEVIERKFYTFTFEEWNEVMAEFPTYISPTLEFKKVGIGNIKTYYIER
jgi:uncharacterized protein YyaL (SSP411 family)